jgi:hypothetical protein
MALLAERGHWYPTVITLFIAIVLFIWGVFCLSGSGLLTPLPFYRWVLFAITAIFLIRGLCIYPPFRFLDNLSDTFWIWSSLICLLIGVTYLFGLIRLLSHHSIRSSPL